ERDSDIGRHPKYFFPQIDNHKFRFALGLDLELARFAHNFNASVFGIAISLNLKFDRHLEQIEILLDLSQNFVTVLLPQNGVLELEFGNAAAIQPLIEEVPQIPAAGLRRYLLKTLCRDRCSFELVQICCENLIQVVTTCNLSQHSQ